MNFDQKTQPSRPDPFGRVMQDDGSQDRFKALDNITSLSGPVGPTAENNPDDAAKAEIMMGMLGELNLAETDGPTGYFGERLRQAIVSFQKKNNLPQTGSLSPNDTTMAVITKAISGLNPGTPDKPPFTFSGPENR